MFIFSLYVSNDFAVAISRGSLFQLLVVFTKKDPVLQFSVAVCNMYPCCCVYLGILVYLLRYMYLLMATLSLLIHNCDPGLFASFLETFPTKLVTHVRDTLSVSVGLGNVSRSPPLNVFNFVNIFLMIWVPYFCVVF